MLLHYEDSKNPFSQPKYCIHYLKQLNFATKNHIKQASSKNKQILFMKLSLWVSFNDFHILLSGFI